jgi:glutathione synthase/RimK-type ligase-like ATP-grasp enzyme
LNKGEKLAEKVIMDWPVTCPKPSVGLVRDRREYPYWTKFERFLKNNEIPFRYYEVHRSDWMAESAQFDVILWATEEAAVYTVEESRRKTYSLEKISGKLCFPSLDTLMWNEDKIAQYDLLRIRGFPVIETFISHDLHEILDKTRRLEYPLVTKSSTGAGSMAVELVKDSRQAEAISKSVFSVGGRKTYWPYFRQKNYVYFQKYQINEGYDLRVIIVGDLALGYYRDAPKGDFRASGMNTVRFERLPEDAVTLARKVSKEFDEITMAVDMLRDPRDGNLYITELGAMPGIDLLCDLVVDGVMGYYYFDHLDTLKFQPGAFWTPELMLREFFRKKWIPRYPA